MLSSSDSQSSNMSVISSPNTSLLCVTNTSLYPQLFKCFDDTVSSTIFIVFTFTNLHLVPLYISVLSLGLQRRRSQGSASSATTSHSDVFTYHMAVLDIATILGSLFFCGAIFRCSQWMKTVGYYVLSFTYTGQTVLHCLSCVERYVAVVHPVTYRSLRQAGGMRIRNVSIGCVLLMCVGSLTLTAVYFPRFPAAPIFVIFAFSIAVVLFCSLCVVHGLIRLGQGRVGGEQIDQSKRRAFQTIMAITGALALRSLGLLALSIIFSLDGTFSRGACVMFITGMWMCLPSNLVLPLLFLHKAGKLSCFSSKSNKVET